MITFSISVIYFCDGKAIELEISVSILAILSTKPALNCAMDLSWSFFKHKVHMNTRESDPTVPQSELLLTTGHSLNAIRSNAISSPTCTTLRNTCFRPDLLSKSHISLQNLVLKMQD